MDSRWFIEDREMARKDKSLSVSTLREESRKALKNSTVFQRRLTRILNEELDLSNRADEDFTKPDWERETVSNISRRKVLREIIKLIPL
jgi:hypothetical protein